MCAKLSAWGAAAGAIQALVELRHEGGGNEKFPEVEIQIVQRDGSEEISWKQAQKAWNVTHLSEGFL